MNTQNNSFPVYMNFKGQEYKVGGVCRNRNGWHFVCHVPGLRGGRKSFSTPEAALKSYPGYYIKNNTN